MSVVEKPLAPFVLSLVAGILVLLGGVTTMLWSSSGMPMWGGMMGGMMGGYHGTMGGMGLGGIFFGMGALAIASGLAVLLGAAMVYSRPREASTWGVVILVFSLVSLFGMGGFFVGAILGVVGGILALTWKPTLGQTQVPAR